MCKEKQTTETSEMGNETLNNVSCWTFNINEKIRVKLTDLGYQRLADLHNSYIGTIPNLKKRTAEYFKNEADKDGYTQFQMWVFMQYFGKVTRIGMPTFFDNDILIEDENLKPYN